jgi:TetR/AcrR family transcriptional regulator, repressor for neighboring sulfatase
VPALIEAATRLFAERGPASVSLREVARAANVNLGLIHRYIGGKDELLAQVLAARPGMPPVDRPVPWSADDIADLVLTLIAADAAYTKIVLRATLDGYDVPEMQVALPLIEQAALAMRQVLPRQDADVRIALLSGALTGWQTLAPSLLGVLGQSDISTAEVAAALRPALVAFLSAEVPAQHASS